MKKAGIPLLILALLIFAGCVQFNLHKFYTDDDLVYKPELVGRWSTGPDDPGVLIFEKGKAGGYIMTHVDEEGRPAKFQAMLSQIKGTLFLDILPIYEESGRNQLYDVHFWPVHTVLHVAQIEPSLKLIIPDASWLEKTLEKNPEMVAFEIVDGNILVTAETKELQDFYLKLLEIPEAWDSDDEPLFKQK